MTPDVNGGTKAYIQRFLKSHECTRREAASFAVALASLAHFAACGLAMVHVALESGAEGMQRMKGFIQYLDSQAESQAKELAAVVHWKGMPALVPSKSKVSSCCWRSCSVYRQLQLEQLHGDLDKSHPLFAFSNEAVVLQGAAAANECAEHEASASFCFEAAGGASSSR